MGIVIDADLKVFAHNIGITSSRLVKEYGGSTIDEIIEKEAEKGNYNVTKVSQEYASSPLKLIQLFRLTNVENRYVLIKNLSEDSRMELLPLLKKEDLAMGLFFFTKEKLLDMLNKVDTEELVNVVMAAFHLDDIVNMFTEEDMSKFFMNKDLDRRLVMQEINNLPPDVMMKFVESVTGMPYAQDNQNELMANLNKLPDDKFKKFMSAVDPDVQRQLIYQMAKEEPETLTLFKNESFVTMLSTLEKTEMVKPMIMLKKETIEKMVALLPIDLMSIVEAQIDAFTFAAFLQKGKLDVLESAKMI